MLVTLGVVLQMIVAGNVPLLGVGRAVLGMGIGVISNSVPLYLSEVRALGPYTWITASYIVY